MKIWRIKGREEMYSDAELINVIENKTVLADDILINDDLPNEIMVKDSIYAFYLEEEKKLDTEA